MRQSAIRRSLGPAKETLKCSGALPHMQSELWAIPTARGELRTLWACCAVSSAGSTGRYLLDRRVLLILSLRTSPPIKLPRLRRRSHSPTLGHHCIFGGDTAIASPASPPLGAPLGPSAGSPLGAQLEARRTADHRTRPPVPPVLLRGQVLGRFGEEEF
ncbi:hypothetical protein NDU88_004081 [Pleurodeles waltl]|uniref:Uncharacterized protein n=1 Tax=Pleurodeles waltl TaxID=8319 RepID=A0AAV7V0A0_PLEWA|nr:hypothetical protein NDU88_004081 [Pleurodeles waltl]